MKSIVFLFSIFMVSLIQAETTKIILNPHTGKLDYITKLSSNTLPPGSTNYMPSSSSNTFVTHSSASLSYVGISSLTASSGILSLSSAAVSYTAISSSTINPFVSTFSATGLNGFKVYASSGPIGANTSITISIPGTTQIWFPVCSELEGVNTVATSIRIKSITSSNFVIYNSDALNAKNYVYWVFAK